MMAWPLGRSRAAVRVVQAEQRDGVVKRMPTRGERIEPTHEWQRLLPLFEWPEQERYEQIRPLVLFDAPRATRNRLPPSVRRTSARTRYCAHAAGSSTPACHHNASTCRR